MTTTSPSSAPPHALIREFEIVAFGASITTGPEMSRPVRTAFAPVICTDAKRSDHSQPVPDLSCDGTGVSTVPGAGPVFVTSGYPHRLGTALHPPATGAGGTIGTEGTGPPGVIRTAGAPARAGSV